MKAFIVVGPESSGTRITTRILIKSGCYGDDGIRQRLDDFVEGTQTVLGGYPLLVIRRSVPNGKDEEVYINLIRHIFEREGYESYVIVSMRDWYANHKSNMMYGFSNDQSKKKLIKAWHWIMKELRPPFLFFNTSLLFKDPEAALQSLEWFTDIPINREIIPEIYDADRKHHHEIEELPIGI